jgi:hypothetical protein
MWLALAAVLLVAGFHFMYYLILWEWTRAAIAGAGFASALVVGGTYILLTRLLRIERRLDQLVLATQEPARVVPGTPTAAPDGEPRPDFPWLATSTTPYALSGLALGALAIVTAEGPERSVFIPVFLAAGLVISAVAGGVERIAAMRQRARSTSSSAPLPTPTQVLGGRSRLMLFGLPVLLFAMAALVVGGLYWTTHYWSKPIGAGLTTMVVEVDRRGGDPTVDIEVVEVMGRYCSINAGTTARYVDVRKGPGDSTLLRVRPLLDGDAQRRYTGCLEDAALEWHRLTVTSTVLAPR